MLKNWFVAIILLAASVGAPACSGGPADPQEHFKRGTDFLQEKKYPEAIVELRSAIQADPKFGQARVKLAEAYLATGDVENAFRETIRAADVLPDDVQAQLNAGHMLLAAGSFEDADERANRVLKRDPRNVDALILKGNARGSLRDFTGALAQYEQAISSSPGDEQGVLGVGAVQMAQGQRQTAEATFRRAAEINPKSTTAKLSLANLYWTTGDMAAAERELRAARELEPANAVVNRALGLLYVRTKRAAEAEPYLVAFAQAEPALGEMTLSNYYLATRRISDARRVLQRAATDAILYPQATTRLAELDFLEGKDTDAQKRIDALLVKSPKFVNALVLKAQILTRQKQYEPALAVLRTALAADPNAAVAHVQVASIYEASGRLEDAIASYEAALRAAANNPPMAFLANLNLGQIHLQRGALDRAVTYAQSALQLQPLRANANLLAARVDAARGDVRSARGRLALLEKSFPDAPGVDLLRAEVELAAKRPDAAAVAFRSALSRDPASVAALTGLTKIDLAAGRRNDAVTRIEAALQRGTTSSPGLQVLAGETYIAVNDLAKAETALRTAIERDPNRFDAYALLGEVYSRQNRLPDAIKQFETVRSRNPKSVSASTAIGVLLQIQGRNAESEKAYEQVLAIDPRAPVAANNLAWLLVESNRDLNRALELAQAARQQLPSDPDIADTLGWIFVKKQMASQAIPLLESGVKANSNNPIVHYHLGIAYQQAGNRREARRSLGRALELSKDFPGADEARTALALLGS